MSTPPLLDFDSLVAPIPGDDPAGTSFPFEVRDQLEKFRKEESLDDYAPDDPRRPATAVKADWAGIVRLCQNTLTKVCKDLQVVARMTEALAQLHGFAGVRDGLVLLRRLVGECWERLSPPIEEPDDVDRRAAALFWLDDPDRGSRFPTTVRQLGIVSYEGTPFGWTQWKQIQEAKGGSNAATFEQAIAATPWERCQAVSTDITEAVQELTTLVQVAGEKMGKSAPSLINLRGALEGCQTLGQQILQRKAPPAAEPVAAENGTAPSTAPATNGAARPTRQGTTRQDVYQQLAQSATLLQQMEPHSPIPYLILRAVQLGSMSFPDLMRALIRDGNVLSELSRELGIKEPETTN